MDHNQRLSDESDKQNLPTGNNQVPSATPTQPPVVPVKQPEPAPGVSKPVVESRGMNASAGKNGGSNMKIIIVVVILALIIAAGAYLYMTQMNKTVTQTKQEDQTITSLQNDVNAINLGSDDDGFVDVDQGLQNL